jgi:hypothetical protein
LYRVLPIVMGRATGFVSAVVIGSVSSAFDHP